MADDRAALVDRVAAAMCKSRCQSRGPPWAEASALPHYQIPHPLAAAAGGRADGGAGRGRTIRASVVRKARPLDGPQPRRSGAVLTPMSVCTAPYAIVVDDEPLIVLDAALILEKAGFRTFEALSGDEAATLLEQHHEAVVLLFSDVDMPGSLDGLALANHVADRWPHIEIVIASGGRKPVGRELPDKATFVPKSFNQHVVIDHLCEKLPDRKKPKQLKRAVWLEVMPRPKTAR